MQLPFTAEQFIHVFEQYNKSIGLLPVLAYLLGALAVYFAFKPSARNSRVIGAVLGSFWAFTGVAYHLMTFSRINPAARVFGIVFVVEAVLLATSAFRSKLEFGYGGGLKSKVGVAVVAWAMIGYPLAGMLLGHGYPAGPVFALTPCPLLLFTFGMLMMAKRMPVYIMPPLVMWTFVGTSASLLLGVREDLSLAAVAITFIGFRVADMLASRRARAIADKTGRGMVAAGQ